MTASEITQPTGSRSAQSFVATAARTAAVFVLGYFALHFYLRDPLHYIVDYSPQSFTRFWPNRFVLYPHIIGGTVALFSGPFQLWSGLRRSHLNIHRAIGYLYIGGIALAGASAFYLAIYAEPPAEGIALFVLASVWWICIAMAFVAIRRRQIDSHRQWMIRGYVLTFAFVTVRYVTDMPILARFGDERFTIAAWLCWTVPLFLTEVALQWRKTLGPRKATAYRSVAVQR